MIKSYITYRIKILLELEFSLSGQYNGNSDTHKKRSLYSSTSLHDGQMFPEYSRDHLVHVPSQWEMTLLGAYTKLSLYSQ